MRDHLPAFVRHLLADRHLPRTVKTYGAILTSFTMFHPAIDIPTRALVEEFLARPRRDGAQRASTSRNQELAALRSFVAFARGELGWTTNPTDGIPFVREAPHDPAVLTSAELGLLFETAARTSRAGERARNLALLAVLSQAGLRVHEAVGLDVHQVDLASATLVAVRGKGGTIHDLPLNSPTVALLGAWIVERGVRDGEQALFLSQRGTRLSIRAAESLLACLRRRMGSAKHITPHTLRHTAATLTLTAGTDLSTVAELLRHSDVNTTRRYLHLVDTRRREAVRRLEGTVPAAILPVPSATTTNMPRGTLTTLPNPREASVSPGPFDLDDQHGMGDIFDTKQPVPVGPDSAFTSRTSLGARCVAVGALCVPVGARCRSLR
ncbi:MAG: tyrosine-type recombinase/integrase [Deltaproteobacteria bacterium]|nr:tyrosine-type recombinase/integrase [Deltaproteobacteria bacterium]